MSTTPLFFFLLDYTKIGVIAYNRNYKFYAGQW